MDELAEQDPLQLEEAGKASRVAWAIAEMAKNGYRPLAPGTPWAGRDDLILALQQEFQIENVLEAAKTIDLACATLWAKSRPDDRQAERLLMLESLADLERELRRMIRSPGIVESTYAYEEERDPDDPTKTKQRKRLVKSKVTNIKLAATGRLLEVFRTRMELQGLKADENGEGASTMSVIIQQLNNISDDEEKAKATTTVLAQLRTADGLNPAGQKKMQAMLKNIADGQQKPKRITSIVRDVEDKEADDEE